MKTSANDVELLANKMYESYKYCFCKDSTETWIKKFAHKRLETYSELAKDLDGKGFTQSFRNKVAKRFTEMMLEYVKECAKIARKKERERLDAEKEKAKTVKRKVRG